MAKCLNFQKSTYLIFSSETPMEISWKNGKENPPGTNIDVWLHVNNSIWQLTSTNGKITIVWFERLVDPYWKKRSTAMERTKYVHSVWRSIFIRCACRLLHFHSKHIILIRKLGVLQYLCVWFSKKYIVTLMIFQCVGINFENYCISLQVIEINCCSTTVTALS